MLETINSSGPVIWLVLLRIGLGALWIRSGLQKIMKRDYLAFDEKLRRFASNNPILWYKTFLERYLIPNSRLAGYFFVTSEVVLGAALVLGFLTVPAAVIASLFNVNFRLAAGWQSPSNTPLNYLMILCQLLVVASGAGGHLSLDALLFTTSTGG